MILTVSDMFYNDVSVYPGLETEPKLPPHLGSPLYDLVKHYNIHPVKVMAYWSVCIKLDAFIFSIYDIVTGCGKYKKSLSLVKDQPNRLCTFLEGWMNFRCKVLLLINVRTSCRGTVAI